VATARGRGTVAGKMLTNFRNPEAETRSTH
jgi:hypothetical protein